MGRLTGAIGTMSKRQDVRIPSALLAGSFYFIRSFMGRYVADVSE